MNLGNHFVLILTANQIRTVHRHHFIFPDRMVCISSGSGKSGQHKRSPARFFSRCFTYGIPNCIVENKETDFF